MVLCVKECLTRSRIEKDIDKRLIGMIGHLLRHNRDSKCEPTFCPVYSPCCPGWPIGTLAI
jgi:hypothetical protein